MKSKFHLIGIAVILVLWGAGCQSLAAPEVTSQVQPAACKQIVFAYAIHGRNHFESNIVSTCPDGSEKRRLTTDESGNYLPVWSPDGSTIAFRSGRSGSPQVHLMDADGANLRQLTFGAGLEVTDLLWLPDGKRLALLTHSGGEPRWQALEIATGEISPLDEWSAEAFYQRPAFSHDGARLAYLTYPAEAARLPGQGQIRVQNLDGSGDHALTPEEWASTNPAWSPDDSRIAFLANPEGGSGPFALYIANADGSNLQRLSEAEFSLPAFFTWSPDGEAFVIFAGDALFVMDLQSGERTTLFTVDYPNHMSLASWQP